MDWTWSKDLPIQCNVPRGGHPGPHQGMPIHVHQVESQDDLWWRHCKLFSWVNPICGGVENIR